MSINVFNKVLWTDMPPLPYTTKGGKTQRVSPPIAKIVLLAIADTADDFGENSFNSYETLSKKASIKRRSTMRATKALIENDYLLANGLSKYGTINFSVLFEKLGTPPKGRARTGRPSKKDAEFLEEMDEKSGDSEAILAESGDSEAESGDSEAESGDPESPYPYLTINNHNITKEVVVGENSEKIEDGPAFSFFIENFGAPTPYDYELLGELCDEHTPHWVIEAMKKSVKANARRLAHTEAILKRWKTEGYGKDRSNNKTAQTSTEDAVQQVMEAMDD